MRNANAVKPEKTSQMPQTVETLSPTFELQTSVNLSVLRFNQEKLDCMKSVPFLVGTVLRDWSERDAQPRGEWGGRTVRCLFPLPHSPCGRLPRSLQSRARSRISLAPVSQLLREKKGTAVADDYSYNVCTISFLFLSWKNLLAVNSGLS